nr:hypothetical protein [Tanacetum cinerariifolium]
MSPSRDSTLARYCILFTIVVIMSSINPYNPGGGIGLAMAQEQQQRPPEEAEAQDIGGLLGGGQRAQLIMQCFTGCSQEIVGCGITCTLGSSQSIQPCITDCGLSTFVCMQGCIQPSVPPEDDPVPAPPGPNPGSSPSNPSPLPVH